MKALVEIWGGQQTSFSPLFRPALSSLDQSLLAGASDVVLGK